MKEFPFDPYDFFGYLAAGFVVLFGLELVVGVPKILGQDLKLLDLTAVVLAAYVAGQIAATPSKWLLEDVIVHRLLKAPSVNLMHEGTYQTRLWLLFPGYFEALPTAIQQRITAKAKAEGLEQATGEVLFLHIRFRDYIRTDATLMGRLASFLNKYGFNRNLSFVALLFCVGVLAGTPFDLTTDTTRYALMAGVTSILLFYRYIKFFKQYTYELFNSYAGRG